MESVHHPPQIMTTADVAPFDSLPGAMGVRLFIGAQDQDTIVTFFAGKSLENPLVWRLRIRTLPMDGCHRQAVDTTLQRRPFLQRRSPEEGAFRLTRIVNYPIGITFFLCYNRYMDMKNKARV